MKIVSSLHALRKTRNALKNNRVVGFVPTMGFLHEGHLSLIRKAKKECDFVIVSIFVNPLQFGPREDLDRYPKDLALDKSLCKKEGVDLLYLPKVKTFYKEPFLTNVSVKELSDPMCGKSRGSFHFDGVTTVVLKLLLQAEPDKAYFGKKDYQQFLLIQQLVKDLDLSVQIIGCPIVRERSGLAMSSRNKYLSPEQKERALVLRKALLFGRKELFLKRKSLKRIREEIQKMIAARSDKLEYIEILNAKTLESVKKNKGHLLIAAAAYFGKARLIDNVTVRT